MTNVAAQQAISALTARGPFASHSNTDVVGYNGPGDDSPAFALVGAYVEPPA